MRNLKRMVLAGLAAFCLNVPAFSHSVPLDTGKEMKEAVELSQQRQEKIKVSGKVVDKNGEPIIGASIKEEGSANGTITDLDGNFSLEVAKKAMLEGSGKESYA